VVATSTTCPIASDLEPLDPAFLSVPFPYLAEQRARTPVFYVPEIDLYFVTRYADVEQIFLDPSTFGAANASSPVWPPCAQAAKILADNVPKRPTLNNADAPRHAPMRKAVLKAMTPRRIAAMEPILQSVARTLITELAAQPTADLVSGLAFPLPGYAAFSLLGFPESDWNLLKQWCRKRVEITYGRLPDSEQIEIAHNIASFWQYCDRHVSAREAERADDFTSDLLDYAAERPEEVTRLDVLTIIYAIALAGHDTTTCALTGGLRYLLAERAQWQALVADRNRIPNAVEEMLRFDPPILGHRRIALRDTEIAGVAIPAGAQLFLTFASAHRDESHFEDADTFDISRSGARTHFAFGKGVHLCIGAPLARLEMKVALEVLTEITPEMRLVDEQDFAMVPNLVFRSMEKLLVTTSG
jgi:cytochrome P450